MLITTDSCYVNPTSVVIVDYRHINFKLTFKNSCERS